MTDREALALATRDAMGALSELERERSARQALEAERDEAQRGEQEAWRQTDQMRAERDTARQALREVRDALRYHGTAAVCTMEPVDVRRLLAIIDKVVPR